MIGTRVWDGAGAEHDDTPGAVPYGALQGVLVRTCAFDYVALVGH